MLARVKPEDLRHTLFPLAYYEKPHLVELAQKLDIPTAYSKESQDVCFVLNGQANYISQVLGKRQGDIVDYDTGKHLGHHDGHYLFTLGQRKGVGVAAGRPVYVVKIDKQSNTVYVGDPHHLEQTIFQAQDVSWICEPEADEFKAMVKIRYNTPAAMATCRKLTNNAGAQQVEVIFDEPAMAVTPGQIAAFYDVTDTEILGGGYIGAHLVHRPFVPGQRELPSYDDVCGIFR
jgi:tRNA-specific 2-thiouridylase